MDLAWPINRVINDPFLRGKEENRLRFDLTDFMEALGMKLQVA